MPFFENLNLIVHLLLILAQTFPDRYYLQSALTVEVSIYLASTPLLRTRKGWCYLRKIVTVAD